MTSFFESAKRLPSSASSCVSLTNDSSSSSPEDGSGAGGGSSPGFSSSDMSRSILIVRGAPASNTSPCSTAPDAAIHPHPRFAALTANIRDRRGDGNVHFAPPRFVDAETPADAPATIEGLDAMAYGMGCCCLQVTFQARDATEARYCYDQLAALAPVMLALTAAAPA